jgi:Ni/Co efflux regulator RcnB
MKKILIALLACFLLVPLASQAQSMTRYLKKKVEKSATKRADKEVDKAVDKAVNKSFDKMLNSLSGEMEEATDSINNANDAAPEEAQPGDGRRESEKRFDTAMGNYMKSMGVGVDVPHKDTYNFSSHMKMLIEQTKAGGKVEDPVYYNTYFSEGNNDYGMEFTDEKGSFTTFLYDTENSCTLILMNDGENMTGIATKISPEQMSDIEDDAKAKVENEQMPENYNLKKTGRSKTISGYKCDEYKSEDDESIVTLWVTKDLNHKINPKVYKNQLFAGNFWLAGRTDGVVIQYDNSSKVNKEHSVMTVQNVDFNASHAISTQGYTLTGISMGGSPSQTE